VDIKCARETGNACKILEKIVYKKVTWEAKEGR
jgi:hypothetical protein